MASSDATAIPVKNQAYRVTFPIMDADGDLVTGATGLDSEVSKDGGTFADATSEATEIATSSGVYYLDLTATEMNADTVAVIVKTSSSGAKTTVLVLYPQEAGDINVDVTYWNGTAVATPDTAGYPKVTAKAGTGTGELNLTSGVINANVTKWSGTAVAAVDTAGYPKVTIKDGTGQGEIATTSGKVDGVVLVDTLTTYTGNTVQTGDAYARIGATGSALTSLATQSSVNTIDDFLDTEIADIQARLPAALTAGGFIKADILAISGDATAADNAESFFDGTGYAGTNNVMPTVTTLTNGVNVDSIDAGAIDANSIAAAAGSKIADIVIRRSFANAAASANGDTKTGRSLLGAIAKATNKWSISGATLTVYESDDSTSLFTQTVTTTAGNPITALDTV